MDDTLGHAHHKVCNIIQEQALGLNIYCILFYNYFSNAISNPQDASKIHQTQLIPFNLDMQPFIIFFIHF
jgi:hypothetical protein